MDTRSKHLQTLGLGTDATSEQIAEAYKDLMKVWHPDRFQNNERLLAKAQAMTQEINHAVSELRKMGKHAHKTSKKTPASSPTFSQQTGPRHHQQSFHQQTSTSQHQGYTEHQFKFTLSPLVIRMRFQSGLVRALGGAIGIYLVWIVLLQRALPTMEQAAIISLGFLAVDAGITNFILTLIPPAIVRVDALGIQIFSHGRLNWIDIESVYPVVTARTQRLHITLSPHHIQKCAFAKRLLYYVRRLFARNHIQINFSALRGDPIHVLDAIHLFQSNNQIELQDFNPAKKPFCILCSFLASSTVLIALTHCIIRGGLIHIELAAYFAIYGVIKTLQTISEIFDR